MSIFVDTGGRSAGLVTVQCLAVFQTAVDVTKKCLSKLSNAVKSG